MALNSNFRTLTADNIEGIVDDRNYLKSSFENGTITGWTEVAVTLTSGLPTGTPTIGATAASSLALSATSVTPLSGSRSLLVDVPSALTAGHGFISDEFTLDRMDLGKVLTVSFDYERITGTYNFSGTLGSQTWMVYIYDATLGAANWIQPAGFLGMNQSSGPGRIRATFQSSVVAGQKYRVAVIASQASAGASSIEFDNFTCSRQTAPIGPVVTDWVSYTPTLTNITIGNGILNGRWRRVGDSIEVDIGITAGSTSTFSASTFTFSVPSGLSIDLGKIAQNSPEGPLGFASIIDAGNQNYGPFNVSYSSSTSVFIRVMRVLGTFPESSGTALQGNPFALGNGDVINVHFSAPISGWSSNVQLSNDTDTRVVAFSAYDGGGVAVTNTTSLLPMGTTEVDTHSVRSGNTYVVPVSGFYRLAAKSTTRFSVANTAFNHALLFYKNGAVQNNGDYGNADGANSAGVEFFFLSINSIVRLNAGDVIDFRYFTNYTGTATTYLKYCSIERLSGPSVVAASETVAASYWSNSAQLIPNGIDSVCVSTPSKIYDTHNMWSAGSGYNSGTGTWTTRPGFTIPVSGKYLITFSCGIALPGSLTFGTLWAEMGHLRGASIITTSAGNRASGNFSDTFSSSGSAIIQANAGDFVGLFTFQSSGASRNINTEPRHTRIEIVRVGN